MLKGVMMKIKFNENLVSIINYIDTKEEFVSFRELLQWCIDMECYKELYIHFHILFPILEEHNKNYVSINKRVI